MRTVALRGGRHVAAALRKRTSGVTPPAVSLPLASILAIGGYGAYDTQDAVSVTATKRSFTISSVDTVGNKLVLATAAPIKAFPTLASGVAAGQPDYQAARGTPFIIKSSDGPSGLPGGYTGQIGYPSPVSGGFQFYPVPNQAQWDAMPGMGLGEGPIMPAQNFAQKQNPVVFTSAGTGTLTLESYYPLADAIKDISGVGSDWIVVDANDLHTYFECPTDERGRTYVRFSTIVRDHTTNNDAKAGRAHWQGRDATQRNAYRNAPAGKRTVGTIQAVALDPRLRWTGALKLTVDLDTVGSNVTTAGVFNLGTSHQLVTGNRVRFRAHSGGQVPTGFTPGGDVYSNVAGANVKFYDTLANAQAGGTTGLITPSTVGVYPYQIYMPDRVGAGVKAGFLVEQREPTSPGTSDMGSITVYEGPTSSGRTLDMASSITTSGSNNGNIGGAGKSLQGNPAGSRVFVNIAVGSTRPPCADTGQGLEDGYGYVSHVPGSTNSIRLHRTKAGALAAQGVATNLTDCIKFTGPGAGEIQIVPAWEEGEPTAIAHPRTSVNTVLAGAVIAYMPEAVNHEVDLNPSDIAVPRVAFRKAGVDLSGPSSGSKGNVSATTYNPGTNPATLGNSTAQHVPLEGRWYGSVPYATAGDPASIATARDEVRAFFAARVA